MKLNVLGIKLLY